MPRLAACDSVMPEAASFASARAATSSGTANGALTNRGPAMCTGLPSPGRPTQGVEEVKVRPERGEAARRLKSQGRTGATFSAKPCQYYKDHPSIAALSVLLDVLRTR